MHQGIKNAVGGGPQVEVSNHSSNHLGVCLRPPLQLYFLADFTNNILSYEGQKLNFLTGNNPRCCVHHFVVKEWENQVM